jgi:heme exporter protein D
MDLGPHADFIIGAYAVAALIVGALVAWVMIDRRQQARILSELEERGLTRRSERGGEARRSEGRGSEGKVSP